MGQVPSRPMGNVNGKVRWNPTGRGQPGEKLNDFEKQKRELKTASWGHLWEGEFALHGDIVPESPTWQEVRASAFIKITGKWGCTWPGSGESFRGVASLVARVQPETPLSLRLARRCRHDQEARKTITPPSTHSPSKSIPPSWDACPWAGPLSGTLRRGAEFATHGGWACGIQSPGKRTLSPAVKGLATVHSVHLWGLLPPPRFRVLLP